MQGVGRGTAAPLTVQELTLPLHTKRAVPGQACPARDLCSALRGPGKVPAASSTSGRGRGLGSRCLGVGFGS